MERINTVDIAIAYEATGMGYSPVTWVTEDMQSANPLAVMAIHKGVAKEDFLQSPDKSNFVLVANALNLDPLYVEGVFDALGLDITNLLMMEISIGDASLRPTYNAGYEDGMAIKEAMVGVLPSTRGADVFKERDPAYVAGFADAITGGLLASEDEFTEAKELYKKGKEHALRIVEEYPSIPDMFSGI